jgi:hypothetical protein
MRQASKTIKHLFAPCKQRAFFVDEIIGAMIRAH